MFNRISGKYRSVILSIALFLLFDASVLSLNFYLTSQIAEDARGINLAGRQRMLSQQMVKSLYDIQAAELAAADPAAAYGQLQQSFSTFNATLIAFDRGGLAPGGERSVVAVAAVTHPQARAALDSAKLMWQSYGREIERLLTAEGSPGASAALERALAYSREYNLELLTRMNNLTAEIESIAVTRAERLRMIQVVGLSLALINFVVILVHFIGALRRTDQQVEAARAETRDILNTVNDGLFLLDRNLVIGAQHSRRLKEIFVGREVANCSFANLLREIVTPKDMDTAARFVALLFRKDIKTNLIGDLNPLSEVEIHLPDGAGGYVTRYLQFQFSRVLEEGEIARILVSVTDVTERVKLARALEDSKQQNEQQLQMLTSILHAKPQALKRFLQNGFDSFSRINAVLKDQQKTPSALRSKLDEIYIEVHNFKAEASALQLEDFADLAHRFEAEIETLKPKADLSGNDFLTLAVSLESLMKYAESVQKLAGKLAGFAELVDVNTPAQSAVQTAPVQSGDWQHLVDLAQMAAKRFGKEIELNLVGFAEVGLNPQERKLVGELSLQFIRNSVAHGIELPAERMQNGKAAQGRIQLQLLRRANGSLEMAAEDDGRGLDYEKIRARAVSAGLLEPVAAAAVSREQLLNFVFQAGFSTADESGGDAGRGVGLDLIARRVREVDGRLKVASRSGKTCRFTVALPAREAREEAA